MNSEKNDSIYSPIWRATRKRNPNRIAKLWHNQICTWIFKTKEQITKLYFSWISNIKGTKPNWQDLGLLEMHENEAAYKKQNLIVLI